MAKKELIEEELIYGAIRREKTWKSIALVSGIVGIVGCFSAAGVAFFKEMPAPVLVAYDPVAGVALPEVNLQAVSLKQQDAVIASLVHSYVLDRETYNQLDNDARISSVLTRSDGLARASLVELWTAGNPNYPPKIYGQNTRMNVEVSSITPIENNRMQARIIKRSTTPDGVTEGVFLITLDYSLNPNMPTNLLELWKNPFRFQVRDYRVTAERFQ